MACQADTLSEAFARFGHIQSVRLVRDKGGEAPYHDSIPLYLLFASLWCLRRTGCETPAQGFTANVDGAACSPWPQRLMRSLSCSIITITWASNRHSVCTNQPAKWVLSFCHLLMPIVSAGESM